jgi:GDP-L-fucose synthase
MSVAPIVHGPPTQDISIRELAELIKTISGFDGEIVFDSSKPDGTPRKLLDVGRITRLGWSAKIPLRDGSERTYRWYVGSERQPSAL